MQTQNYSKKIIGDPIADSTSEYIHGRWQCESETAERISPHGLHCVTCLFGVFDSRTGFPLIGVLNQPFFRQHSQSASNGYMSHGQHSSCNC